MPNQPAQPSPPPARRVVLLGASNIARSLATVIANAEQVLGEPLDILAAFGHGRSYGQASCVLGRTLPGITECGLWPALAARPPLPTYALLTDIGNDLLYDVPVPRIVTWIETCLVQLSTRQTRIIITELPLKNLEKLSDNRFTLLRTLLFPRSRRTLASTQRDAEQLNSAVVQLAERFAAQLLPHRTEWYGFDPIHLRLRHWPAAWHCYMQPWRNDHPTTPASGTLTRWIYLRALPPAERLLFGMRQTCPQPAGHLANGTRLAFY